MNQEYENWLLTWEPEPLQLNDIKIQDMIVHELTVQVEFMFHDELTKVGRPVGFELYLKQPDPTEELHKEWERSKWGEWENAVIYYPSQDKRNNYETAPPICPPPLAFKPGRLRGAIDATIGYSTGLMDITSIPKLGRIPDVDGYVAKFRQFAELAGTPVEPAPTFEMTDKPSIREFFDDWTKMANFPGKDRKNPRTLNHSNCAI